MKIYDGKGVILGRLATVAAKQALLGEDVAVLNCEQVVISGKVRNTLDRGMQRRRRKGYPPKSAKPSRLPERMVRRTIRGMLPWKQARGKEAFRRVMCYRGIPAALQGKPGVGIAEASAAKLPTLQFITVGELCRQLGWKGQ